MIYKLAADFLVLIHLGWILFLILGAVIGVRRILVMWVHLGAMAFSLVLQIFSWICPLTHLEFWLRQRHDASLAYPGSFIAHYAEELVYLRVDPAHVFVATLGIVMANLWLYGWAWKRRRSRPDSGRSSRPVA